MRTTLALLLALLVLASPATRVLSQENTARADGQAPYRIGVVDLATVFQQYKKSKNLEQRINDERDALRKELDDLRKQITEISKELELLDPESEAFQLKEEERKITVARFELKKERFESLIDKLWEKYNLEILDDIEAVVRSYGEEQKFTLILKVEGKPLEESRFMKGKYLLAAKASKTVFYYSGEIDITRAIVERLNRQFDLNPKGAGSVEAGSTRPAGTGK